MKEWVFVRPQIRQLMKDVISEDQLSEVGKAAWKSFKNSTTNFFFLGGGGNHKAEHFSRYGG